jgi:hypothetical protein
MGAGRVVTLGESDKGLVSDFQCLVIGKLDQAASLAVGFDSEVSRRLRRNSFQYRQRFFNTLDGLFDFQCAPPVIIEIFMPLVVRVGQRIGKFG